MALRCDPSPAALPRGNNQWSVCHPWPKSASAIFLLWKAVRKVDTCKDEYKIYKHYITWLRKKKPETDRTWTWPHNAAHDRHMVDTAVSCGISHWIRIWKQLITVSRCTISSPFAFRKKRWRILKTDPSRALSSDSSPRNRWSTGGPSPRPCLGMERPLEFVTFEPTNSKFGKSACYTYAIGCWKVKHCCLCCREI